MDHGIAAQHEGPKADASERSLRHRHHAGGYTYSSVSSSAARQHFYEKQHAGRIHMKSIDLMRNRLDQKISDAQ